MTTSQPTRIYTRLTDVISAPCLDCGGHSFALLLSRCVGCRYTAPLSPLKLCGACEMEKLEGAGQRAVNPQSWLSIPPR